MVWSRWKERSTDGASTRVLQQRSCLFRPPASESCVASPVDPLPDTSPIQALDPDPHEPPRAIGGRFRLLAMHFVGYIDFRRIWRPEAHLGSPNANFEIYRSNRQSALRGVQICHMSPGKETRAATQDLLDEGRGQANPAATEAYPARVDPSELIARVNPKFASQLRRYWSTMSWICTKFGRFRPKLAKFGRI